MTDLAQFAVVTFTAILMVVDPFAAVPIFLSITVGDDTARRRSMALRASLAAFALLSLFALAGGLIFQAFGISLGAFKIAGGLMLLLMAIDMMRAQPSRTRSTPEEREESLVKEDVAIVPMAIPMLAGPGAIATVMVFMGRADTPPRIAVVYSAIAVTCLITFLLLRSSVSAARFLRPTVLHVFERVMGLLLAAVAVEFIVGGFKDLIPALR